MKNGCSFEELTPRRQSGAGARVACCERVDRRVRSRRRRLHCAYDKRPDAEDANVAGWVSALVCRPPALHPLRLCAPTRMSICTTVAEASCSLRARAHDPRNRHPSSRTKNAARPRRASESEEQRSAKLCVLTSPATPTSATHVCQTSKAQYSVIPAAAIRH